MPAPTSPADPFTALGLGNGFPFCPQKADVSGETKWVTLGGTQKGSSPTQGEIDLSLKNAMKLFWSLNGITLDGEETYSRSPANNYSVTVEIDGSTAVDTTPFTNDKDETQIEWYNLEYADDPTGFPLVDENQEPNERACYRSGDIYRLIYNSSEGYTDYGSNLSTTAAFNFVRMYDGVTTNEDNFVGYGAGNIASGGGTLYADQWQLWLGYRGPYDPSVYFCLAEYVEIGGMPCVATFINFNNFGPISGDTDYTVTLTSDSTGVTGNSSYTNVDGQGSYTNTDELKYSDLNFYAYS
eukprot:GHVU01186095.1.p1 GENE.GHVU01186095.1~~GHVU01186095.1.p1  ORF type:complete len:297 (-),score=18.17 GHVU01186095.1:157-1047(-)